VCRDAPIPEVLQGVGLPLPHNADVLSTTARIADLSNRRLARVESGLGQASCDGSENIERFRLNL